MRLMTTFCILLAALSPGCSKKKSGSSKARAPNATTQVVGDGGGTLVISAGELDLAKGAFASGTTVSVQKAAAPQEFRLAERIPRSDAMSVSATTANGVELSEANAAMGLTLLLLPPGSVQLTGNPAELCAFGKSKDGQLLTWRGSAISLNGEKDASFNSQALGIYQIYDCGDNPLPEYEEVTWEGTLAGVRSPTVRVVSTTSSTATLEIEAGGKPMAFLVESNQAEQGFPGPQCYGAPPENRFEVTVDGPTRVTVANLRTGRNAFRICGEGTAAHRGWGSTAEAVLTVPEAEDVQLTSQTTSSFTVSVSGVPAGIVRAWLAVGGVDSTEEQVGAECYGVPENQGGTFGESGEPILLTATDLSSGTRPYRVCIEDSAGNRSQGRTGMVTLTIPEAASASLEAGSQTSSSFSVRVTRANNQQVRAWLAVGGVDQSAESVGMSCYGTPESQGAEFTDGDAVLLTAAELTTGLHPWRVCVEDVVGNRSEGITGDVTLSLAEAGTHQVTSQTATAFSVSVTRANSQQVRAWLLVGAAGGTADSVGESCYGAPEEQGATFPDGGSVILSASGLEAGVLPYRVCVEDIVGNRSAGVTDTVTLGGN